MFNFPKKIKIVSKFKINTVIMLVLIFVFTLVLVSQKDILISVNEIKNKHYAGIGTELPKNIRINNWRNYYGGSMGFDEAVKFDGPSIRVSTGVNGGWYGARADINSESFEDKSIRFAVRFDDFNTVKTFLILFGSDNGIFDNYYAFNIKNFFADPTNNTWHEIVIDKSDFEVIAGKPDWSNITDIALRVSGESGVYTRVWFGGLTLIDNNHEPLISLTFDDGFKSNLLAAQIMEKYGYKGTAYVIPQYINLPNFLTQTDIDYLSSIGWDISGHGHTNLRLYSFVDVDTQLSIMKSYLDSNNYKGRQHFSYPNGGYTDSIRSLVSEYFETARTIDGLSQPQGYIIPTKINSKTVSVIHSTNDLKGWIDGAIKEKSWLVITWHDLVQNPSGDTQYNIEKFEEIIGYIKDNNVEVLPFSDAYAKITKMR